MMNLTDQEILELSELCSAVVDNRLTHAQRERLSAWLSSSEDARRYYVRALGLSASLHSYAAETHLAAAPRYRPRFRQRAWWIGSSLAAAAGLAVIIATRPFLPEPGTSRQPVRQSVNVARLTAAKDVVWQGKGFAPGMLLPKGQNLELTSGYAELTFDSGARLVLEGPASFTVNSAWDSTLRRGTLKATVPPQAIGFRISNPSVEVVDFGTEFTMIAGSDGGTEVLVLKGEVEAAPRNSMNEQEILRMRENDSRRFSRDGMSEVADSEQKFARFSQPLTLERFTPAYRHARWSFDDAGSHAGTFSVAGTAVQSLEARMDADQETGSATEGPWRTALHLDGNRYLQTRFPGLSGATPHTVAFWVRVAENAPLPDAYSILGWRSSLPKLSYRPVHISWNRNPNEGALGAIRTDFAGGCAIGTSSLRDGRWHHIAIVFASGADDKTPVQVKQYVDGFLESSTIIPGRTRGPAGQRDDSLDDLLWIGSRLGATGLRQERFRGDIDELFIADGTLEPQEIVRLVQENRFAEPFAEPVSALASH